MFTRVILGYSTSSIYRVLHDICMAWPVRSCYTEMTNFAILRPPFFLAGAVVRAPWMYFTVAELVDASRDQISHMQVPSVVGRIPEVLVLTPFCA